MDEMNNYTKDKESWLVEDGYDDEDEETEVEPTPDPNDDVDEDLEHESYVGC